MRQSRSIHFRSSRHIWAPSKLADAVSVFDKYANVQLVASRYEVQDNTSGTVRVDGPSPAVCGALLQANGRSSLNLARQISTPTVVVRRESLKNCRFDPSLQTAEDRDLWIRLLLTGKCYFIEGPLVSISIRSDSLSHANIDMDCNCMLRVIQRYAAEIGSAATRRGRSYVYFKWAMGRGTGREAWAHLLQSLPSWPLPFSRKRTPCHAARLRFTLGLCYRELLARRLLHDLLS